MALGTKDAVHIGVPRFDGEGEPHALSFSPDGTRIVAGEVRWTSVWKLDGTRVFTAAPGGQPVWLGNDQVLVTGYSNQPCMFDAATGELVSAVNANAQAAIPLDARSARPDAIFHGKFANGASGLTRVSPDGDVLAEEGEMLPFDDEGRIGMGFADMEIVSLCATRDASRIAVLRRKERKSTVRVVDAELREIWTKELAPEGIAFDPSGTRLALALGKTITILDAATGAEQSTIAVEGRARCLAYSPSGTLAIGLAAGGVLLVDAQGKTTGTFVPNGLAPDEGIAAVAWSPDGTHLAAGLSTRLTVKNMTTGKELGAPPAHVRGTHFAAILPGSASIVTRGATATKVWTLGSGELTATHAHEEEIWPVLPLEAGPGGVLFDAGADGVIRLRDALRWQVAGEIAVHAERGGEAAESKRPGISALSAAPAAKRLAVLFGGTGAPDSEATVRVFHLETGAELRVFGRDPLPAPPPPPPDPELDQFRRPREGGPTPHRIHRESRIALSPDGTLLAFTTRNDEFEEAIHVVEVATGTHRGHVPADIGAKSLSFFDAHLLFSETSSGEIRSTVLASSAIGATTSAFYGSHATLSPSRSLLASWDSETGAIHLRGTADLSADPLVVADRIGISALVFSEDERFLAAIVQDGSVRVWSISR